MKITKFGHCCLLIEIKGLRILTDPGAYTTAQNGVKNIDVVLITHEHADHLHVGSLRDVIANAGSRGLVIMSNKSVGKLLDIEGVKYQLLEHNQKTEFKGVLFEAYGQDHWPMYLTIPKIENTGYFIDRRFFYPGDGFYEPNKKVEILALPVAGPWATLSESIDYALRINPKVVFPVHEGMLQKEKLGPVHKVPNLALTAKGIQFKVLEEGQPTEFE